MTRRPPRSSPPAGPAEALQRAPAEEGERQLRDFLKHANYLIQSASLDGRLLFVNQAWQRTLGYDDADLRRGLSLLDVLAPSSRSVVEAMLRAAVAGGESQARALELTFVARDGREVLATGEIDVRVVDGVAVATRGIFRDVTTERAAEARARLVEARHDAVISVLGEGIAIISADGTIEMLNPSAERILGLKAAAVVGHGLMSWRWAMIDEDGGELPREAHPAFVALHTGQAQTDVVIGVRHGFTGVRVWLAVNARPLVRTGERIPYAAVTSFRDVTAARYAVAALREREARFRGILETVRSVAVCLDTEGRITFANDYLLDLTGWARDEVLGVSWAERFVPADQRSVRPMPPLTVRGDAQTHYEHDILTRAGEVRRILWDTTALHDDLGRIIGSASIGHDVTARARVQQLKDEMIGVASHELRTPLTSIRGALDLLRADPAPRPERDRRLVEMAWRNAERLNRLVTDLLDVERIESGTEVVHPASVPVTALFAATTDATRVLLAGPAITLRLVPSPLRLWIDAPRIEQVLTNLIGNAVKFSPARSTITVSVAASGDEAQLTVRDEGRGIPAEKLESVFEPFVQVTAEDGTGRRGAGLGLTICRSIIRQHGGRIWAESQGAGRGTTMHFTVPLSREVGG